MHVRRLLCAASFAAPVVAWGAAGHEIVATIAQIHLHPSVFPRMCDVLNFTSRNPDEWPCHLAPVATWADTNRNKMRWSAPMHYVGAVGDHPSQLCAFPGRDPGGQSFEVANEALKFLVHFLGDMHMPLHLTGRDRGGNLNKVLFGGRQTNLHSLWDGLLIAKALQRVVFARHDLRLRHEITDWLACPAPPHPSLTPFGSLAEQVLVFWQRFVTRDAALDTDDELICPYAWARPIHAFNCDLVWPPTLDQPPYDEGGPPYLELDTPNYSGVIARDWVVEKLLAQAGIRLAGILNYLFAEYEGEGKLRVYS
ncbi:hypothetical protein MKEN_00709300 [Mycena kentingensis (nom. inval.)]|nr:hypothetical protein MKEN_00709300 [Mycena kentingensis (nom. inval.)]